MQPSSPLPESNANTPDIPTNREADSTNLEKEAQATPINSEKGTATPPPIPPQTPVASRPAPVAATPLSQPTNTQISTPTTASNDELIEKEWVDQAEKIIEDYGQDPRREEAAEHALNQDYLKKRFNFKIEENRD